MDSLARNFQGVASLAAAGLVLALLPVAALAAGDITVQIVEITEPAGEPDCDRRALQHRIVEETARTGTVEYETMLSFALRDEGDYFSRLMADPALDASSRPDERPPSSRSTGPVRSP